ncbi:MAG: SulP family inorganic anion transporter, partial [Mariprofundaceae bacterium]
MTTSLNLKGNLFGGLTAAVIALPLALAFGVASGLGPAAGIYGAIILGFVAALFGGTPTQISGPTGPMTVVLAAAVVTLHHDVELIAASILLAGLFQIIFGFAKIGQLVRFVPYPVISGFMSGIGIIIIIIQINPLLGQASDTSVLHILLSLPQTLSHTNIAAFALASLALIIVFFTPHQVSKWIPTPLIALVVLTPLSLALNLSVETIGNIPSDFPDITLPTFTIDSFKIVVPLA